MSRRHALTRRTALKALGAAGIVGAAGTGISFAANGSSDGSDDSSGPHLAWMKKYDLDVSFADIVALDGGGYAVGGSTPTDDDVDHQFWLAALDDNGDVLWSDTYGDGTLNAIVPAADSGFFLLGTDYLEPGERYPRFGRIVKTKPASDGMAPDVDWSKRFDDDAHEGGGRTGTTTFVDAVPVDDGIVALGSKDEGYDRPRVLKFGADGSVEWEWYRPDFGMSDAYAEDLIRTNDGGFVTVALGDSGKGTNLYKLAEDGSAEWRTGYHFPSVGGGAQHESGAYAFSGERNHSRPTTDISVYMADSGGENSSYYDYDHEGGTDAHGTFATDDGFLLAGHVGYPNSDKNVELYFLEVDTNGEKLTEFTIGRDDTDLGYTDMTSVDGGYVVAGWAGTPDDPMIAKVAVPDDTDEAGNDGNDGGDDDSKSDDGEDDTSGDQDGNAGSPNDGHEDDSGDDEGGDAGDDGSSGGSDGSDTNRDDSDGSSDGSDDDTNC